MHSANVDKMLTLLPDTVHYLIQSSQQFWVVNTLIIIVIYSLTEAEQPSVATYGIHIYHRSVCLQSPDAQPSTCLLHLPSCALQTTAATCNCRPVM